MFRASQPVPPAPPSTASSIPPVSPTTLEPRTQNWVGCWGAAPQLVESEIGVRDNRPPCALQDATLRQIILPTLDGSRVRLSISNAWGDAPVTMRAIHIADAMRGDAITASSSRQLTFGGSPSLTLRAGESTWSDPVSFSLQALKRTAISIHFGQVPNDTALTGHPGSRTTSYIQPGNAVNDAHLTNALSTEHWYFITAIDVLDSTRAAAVVTLGDSLTDGRGSTTDGNDRWPDFLARRLQGSNIGVLNMGIGGNTVVRGGLGPTALERFDRDALGQSSVRWVILLEGINDIGEGQRVEALVAAYERFVAMAHAKHVKVFASPILPFGGSIYDRVDTQRKRDVLNDWIRNSNCFDAVVDFDRAVRDPGAPHRLLDAYDCGDGLHLHPAGYEAIARAIDLRLFDR